MTLKVPLGLDVMRVYWLVMVILNGLCPRANQCMTIYSTLWNRLEENSRGQVIISLLYWESEMGSKKMCSFSKCNLLLIFKLL